MHYVGVHVDIMFDSYSRMCDFFGVAKLIKKSECFIPYYLCIIKSCCIRPISFTQQYMMDDTLGEMID